MPALSDRISFDPTLDFFASKIPMKFSLNGQKFATPKTN